MEYNKQQALQLRVLLRLKSTTKKIEEAYERFRDIYNDNDEAASNVENMAFVIDRVQNFNERVDGKDLEDVLCELQESYCKEALEDYGESPDGYRSIKDMVEAVQSLNEEENEKTGKLF